MIGSRVGISARPHCVTVQQPDPPVADGDGGYTQTWTDAAVAGWYVEIAPLSTGAIERLRKEGTTRTTASHQVTGPFRADLTTASRLLFGSRVLTVDAIKRVDERGDELVAVCTEQVA